MRDSYLRLLDGFGLLPKYFQVTIFSRLPCHQNAGKNSQDFCRTFSSNGLKSLA
jgi:hypothetical protein